MQILNKTKSKIDCAKTNIKEKNVIGILIRFCTLSNAGKSLCFRKKEGRKEGKKSDKYLSIVLSVWIYYDIFTVFQN